MTVILKNTFIDVVVPLDESLEVAYTRRSESVPPTWKPFRCCKVHDSSAAVAPLSDASTVASEDDSMPTKMGFASDCEENKIFEGHDAGDSNTDDYGICQIVGYDTEDTSLVCDTPTVCNTPRLWDTPAACHTPPECDTPPECGRHKLCLDACVVKTKTRLSPKTLSFVPQAQAGVPEEISALVRNLETFLNGVPDMVSVKVSECAMGGTTTLLAEVSSHSLGAALIPEMVNSARAMISNFSAESSGLYMLGYRSQPFKDITNGFKVSVGYVSTQLEQHVCWDVYEKGYCPRRNTCRWHHPFSTELMQLVFKIQEVS